MNRDRGPGPVHKQLLAGFVLLAQNHVLRATPALIDFTEIRLVALVLILGSGSV